MDIAQGSLRSAKPRRTGFVCGMLLSCLTVISSATSAEPVRVILDTDMDSDCDDVAALAMLHALADDGEADILGVMVSARHPSSPACVDAINTFFGRPDLPLGRPLDKALFQQASKYAESLAAEFPHDTRNVQQVPGASEAYRRILAVQPDGSVTVVSIGDLTNLSALLSTAGDEISPLNGTELVENKVKRWVCMGSRYPADLDPGRWGNFKLDPHATVAAVHDWPTPVIFTGGGAFAESLATGAGLIALPEHHPVRRAYELYFDGTLQDRHSADQIAVLVAIRGAGSPWQHVMRGHNHIFENGTHVWKSSPDNPLQSYISALQPDADPRSVAAIIEALMTRPRKVTSP